MLSMIAESLGSASDSRRRRLIHEIETAVELAAYAASTADAQQRRKAVARARVDVAVARTRLSELDLISSHYDLVASVLDLLSRLLDQQESGSPATAAVVGTAIDGGSS